MSDTEQRPPVWIGHVTLRVARFPESCDFLIWLGMREVARMADLAVLELRGGTHLVLQHDRDAVASTVGFDLMVDDLAAMHDKLAAAGHEPSGIEEGRIHSSFEVVEPSGHTIKFNDSHVVGVV